MNRLTDMASFSSLAVDRRSLNGQLRSPTNDFMISRFGHPRSSYDEICRNATRENFIRNICTIDVGPFEVTGLRPALEDLASVFASIKRDRHHVYSSLGPAGMLCCRYARGSDTIVSNHSWGIALDLKIDDELDIVGDNKVQYGLLEISSALLRAGFVWGAAFPVEDSMHFEASEQLICSWIENGRVEIDPYAVRK